MKKEVKIPDIAENVESGLVAGILVKEGDKVEEDQPLVEIETDKAATDIPSPYSGTVSEIKIKEGDEVEVHQVIMIIDTREGEEKEEKAEPEEKPKEEPGEEPKEKPEEKPEEEPEEESKKEGSGEEPKKEEKEEPEEKDREKPKKENLSDIPAAPSVRRLAREMKVDITEVKGTGPGKRLTADDIKAAAGKEKEEPAEKAERQADFSKWGSTEEEKMSNTRKITAKNVSEAWRTIPHVTQFDEADMTGLNKFMEEIKEKISKEGAKLTVTAVLLKIITLALRKFPSFNASLDMEAGMIIYKHYLNIGVAVDTPRGLLVPIIKEADKKSLAEISVELSEVAQKVREKKVSLEELQGGTFTISNLGGIGGTAFTPIVYPPQVAILGVSRAAYKKIYVKGKFKKRMVIPLSLSYDHRVIDGADGARFLRWICDVIENPYAVIL
ncbi:MAG: dihydrolipoamide acetyltransferase family protein [Bacteroidales bacterium]